MAFDFADKVLLAPMAGVSDPVMRRLCREQGADMAYTEMVSSKGLSYANDKTRHLIDPAEGEDAVAVQLFGREPATMAAQAAWVQEQLGDALAFLDINMGCPARKIVSKGDGSALMQDPPLAAAVAEAVVRAVDAPVTCKFRRGFRRGDETAPAFARRLEQAGVAAVAVHGRFAEQLYEGASDSGVIARVKEAVQVPVIGNGDIRCGADALAMRRDTGCDAVMVGRAAEGNPWVFADIKAVLAGSEPPAPPTAAERIAMARRHARELAAREGRQIVRMRKHACWYLAGMPGAAKARGLVNQCTSLDDFEDVFDRMEAYAARSL